MMMKMMMMAQWRLWQWTNLCFVVWELRMDYWPKGYQCLFTFITCVFVFVILDQCLFCVFELVEFVKEVYLNAHLCIWVCNFVSVYLNLLKRFILMPTCGQPRKQLATRCVCTVLLWIHSFTFHYALWKNHSALHLLYILLHILL